MTEKKVTRRQPKRSIRTLLMLWCFVFSIVPVCFVAGYSLYRYQEAVDNELVQRLRGNTREFITIIGDYEKYLQTRLERHSQDTTLGYYIASESVAQAKALMSQSLKNTYLSEMSIFSLEGRLLATLRPTSAAQGDLDGLGRPKSAEAEVYLLDSYRETVLKKGRLFVAEPGASGTINLIAITKVPTKNDRTAGFVEEIITLGPTFLENFKKRMSLEVILFDAKGDIVTGSHPDFKLHKKDQFAKLALKSASGEDSFFDLPIRDESYGFMISALSWGDSKFMVGLGASKQKTDQIKQQINYAFFSVIGTVILLLVIAIWFAVRVAVRPLNDLIYAIETMDQHDEALEIPVKSDNEIGVLTESFNEMSRRTQKARQDLQKKIQETERAYQELKETQARLLHSAKMASIGQLVAGVAHELNNPIGFIYSNMSHLRDYSGKLLQVIDVAEKNPKLLQKTKDEVDFDYILKDMPRLIQSCEEGARRTRDIVLGLRNFSRLEEARLKRVNILEGIENTISLLSGELKGRIQVHADFKPLPEVLCYASELNQVFMNILSNAAQAIEGNGEIWISTQHPPGSGQVQISIRDSGKGMSEETVEKIFDPFFTTKTLGQGTGLGLSISYGIVQRHGGDITVKSELGQGTEFIIVLPIEGPAANSQAKATKRT
jgi:two-component system NtrC family sensor kinase